MAKNAKEFIDENFERHDYVIGPDDNPNQTNYIHKDGSYRVADPAEIAERYADEVRRIARGEILQANAQKAQIELRLAEALKSLESERQARTGDKSRITELKRQIKASENALQKISDETEALTELDGQFKQLRKEDIVETAKRLKTTLESQLAETVKSADFERPANMSHRLKVNELKKRLSDAQAAIQKIAEDAGTLISFSDEFKKQRREDAVLEATRLKDLLGKQLADAVQATDQEKPVTAAHKVKVAELKQHLKEVGTLLKKLSDEQEK